jgi:hypothetical protein
LLAAEAKMHVKTVAGALKELKRAGFIVQVRKPRPHHSEAFQVQWAQLAEAQARWELEALSAMEAHKRLRADKAAEYRAKIKVPKRTDILPRMMRCSPVKRRGYPQSNDSLKERPNPQSNDGVNSYLNSYECNSLNGNARSGEPSPLKRWLALAR